MSDERLAVYQAGWKTKHVCTGACCNEAMLHWCCYHAVWERCSMCKLVRSRVHVQGTWSRENGPDKIFKLVCSAIMVKLHWTVDVTKLVPTLTARRRHLPLERLCLSDAFTKSMPLWDCLRFSLLTLSWIHSPVKPLSCLEEISYQNHLIYRGHIKNNSSIIPKGDIGSMAYEIDTTQVMNLCFPKGRYMEFNLGNVS